MEPYLKVDHLSVQFSLQKETFFAVDDISFSLNPGETLGLIGPSGSGKTTIALSLLRLLKTGRISGSAFYQNQNLLTLSEKKLCEVRGKEIGLISQNPMSALNPTLKIGPQVVESLLRHKLIEPHEAKEKTKTLLEWVGISNPAVCINQYPHELSGGQKQRVLIAIALSCSPKILIADEPTTALDYPLQLQIIQLLQTLQRRFSMSLLIISHDMKLVSQLCERILVMEQGKLISSKKDPKIFSTTFLKYDKTFSHQSESKKPLLDVQQLSVGYSTRGSYLRALTQVSFSMQKADTLTLIGESGAGKSTLAKTLLGLIPYESGHIYFEGKKLSFMEGRSIRKHIQMVFQDPVLSLNPCMSVEEILKEPFRIHKISYSAQMIKQLLEQMQLPLCVLSRLPHELSGGQKQRVNIARTLALRPSFLIFDEPFSSLDPALQVQMIDLLKELQKELGLSYLFISHNLPLAIHVSSHLAVLHQGELVEIGPTPNICNHPTHEYTKYLIQCEYLT